MPGTGVDPAGSIGAVFISSCGCETPADDPGVSGSLESGRSLLGITRDPLSFGVAVVVPQNGVDIDVKRLGF